jgi:hypothetical protein
MSGESFLPLLTGRSSSHREWIYAARLAHGNSPVTDRTRSSTFDLSRCVRTKQFKVIYNCTPQYEYQPVDSANDPGWKETVAAHKAGKLKPEWERLYFGKRPVLEFYDLTKDPAELNNVAGQPDYAAAQRQLLEIMQEKMILDYDFLPLPLSD